MNQTNIRQPTHSAGAQEAIRTRDGGPIRVLHVVPFLLSGGVERRRLSLARHLGPEFEQELACFTGRGPIYKELCGEMPVHRLSYRRTTLKDPTAHVLLHALVWAYRPHVLHAAIFDGSVWGGITGLLQRVPVVLLEETSCPDDTAPDDMRRSARSRALIRFLSTRTDGIVAVAPQIERYLLSDQRIPRDRVHMVFNGVADFELAPREEALAERRRLGFDDDAFVLGGVGRMHNRHKRFTDFLEAVHEARQKHDVRALFIGAGGDLEMLERKAHDLGLEGVTVFAGRREDRHLFFAMMDAFMLSSATEAAPLALIEAMMAGLPCIATTVGGVPDIAQDGVSAILLPPLQPDRLAEAISRIVEDDALRQRLAAGARERASSHFSAERYAGDVRSLYLERLRDAGIVV